MDYDSTYLYRNVPERRLKESKYSRRIQNGICNDADEERAAGRKMTDLKNEKEERLKSCNQNSER